MFDAILVATDGSDAAEAAARHAGALASRYDARVHVLSVVDSRSLENAPQSDRVRDEHEERTAQTAAALAEWDVPVEQAVRTDIPHRGILRYARETDVDLVAVGTHGRSGVDRYVMGSVAELVVREANVPVMTVSEAAAAREVTPYGDVLVPTDGSAGAEAAVAPAVDIARTYGARIHALSVLDTLSLGVDVRSAGLLDALEESATEAVDGVAAAAQRAGVDAVTTAVEHGSPDRAIRDYVKERGVDLVVMGTHGRSGIERVLLGSVAERVVRTAPVPVVTVRRSS